jgi:DNA-binding transcriptional regulator GbsR (MarR family)
MSVKGLKYRQVNQVNKMTYSTIEETHFVEDIGLYFERLGLPRMAGRILGVLLISDPPAQSITEIGEKLNASKSSISIMSRLLLEVGLIEKVPSPIPRRDYFKFKTGGWMLYMQQWFDLMAGLHKITERGLNLLEEKPAELRNRLMEAHDLFSYLEEHFPTLLVKLKKDTAWK